MSDESKIKIGDVVALKCDPDGQCFTVGSYYDYSEYFVHWFDYQTKDLKSVKIHIDALMKVN